MLKKLLYSSIRIIILWFIALAIIQTGIYFWGFIENLSNLNSSYKFQKWNDFIFQTGALIMFLLIIGYLIKIKFPTKSDLLYYLRWGILFSLFPVFLGFRYIFLDKHALFNVMYMVLLFLFTGFIIGYIDKRYRKKYI